MLPPTEIMFQIPSLYERIISALSGYMKADIMKSKVVINGTIKDILQICLFIHQYNINALKID